MITTRIAKALSALLHPLLLPTYLHAILLAFAPAQFGSLDSAMEWRLLVTVFLLTFLIPLTSIVFLHYSKLAGNSSRMIENSPTEPGQSSKDNRSLIHSMLMDNRSQRFVPFLSTTLFYGLTTWMFSRNLSVLHVSVVVMAAITLAIGTVTLITLFWKISAHATGMGGVIGFMLALNYCYAEEMLFYPVVGAVVLTGALLSARLQLNAHTPAQIFTGLLLGFGICFAAVYGWV